jgi:hypothetical protein
LESICNKKLGSGVGGLNKGLKVSDERIISESAVLGLKCESKTAHLR